MSKSNKSNNKITNKENKKMTTPDITRTHQFRNGQLVETNAFRLAKLLADKRRKGNPVSRKVIMEKLDFDPAPYAKLYDCFEQVDRGEYIYVGSALQEIA